jgi:putative ATP-dependent endonuclease of OLD family
MARIKTLRIKAYRSIRDDAIVNFPENKPVTIVGENNAGKSNIVRALDILFGELWPGSRTIEDHDFWGRDPSNGPIQIEAAMEGLHFTDKYGQEKEITSLHWSFDPAINQRCLFFGTLSTGGEYRYISNELRDNCISVLVGADRRLSYQLSYAFKGTLLAKLMRKFHDRLTQDLSRVDMLKTKFSEIRGIFEEVAEFGSFSLELTRNFGDMFSGMSYGLQIDFSAYDPSNYFHSLKVLPKEGDEIRTFEELGTGQEQLLALVFAHAYAKAFFGGIILVIEEPEAHLHPLAQKWLSRKITEMSDDGLQVVLTSHSPLFTDLLSLEGLVLAKKEDGATRVVQATVQELTDYCISKGASRTKTSPLNILPFYSSAATDETLAGFFAKKIVLVEGSSEVLSLPVYLKRAGLDVLREGIAIISVMGKGNLAKWYRLYSYFGIPVYVIFDNDSEHDQDTRKRTDILRTLGCRDEEVNLIIGISEWAISERYCIFGEKYESSLRQHLRGYQELEREARNQVGDSKPLVARHIAEKANFSDDDAFGRKLGELVVRIRQI